MPRKAKHSRKGKKGGLESCPGYVDEHGIWNNGFPCPRWGGRDEQYCCGDECCPEPRDTPQPSTGGASKHYRKININNRTTTHRPQGGAVTTTVMPELMPRYIPLIASLCIASFVVLLCFVIGCFVCRCCPLHKSRKSRGNNSVPTSTTTTVTAATCATCHHHQSVTTLASNEPVTVTRLHCGCQGCNTLQRSHTGSHTPTSSVHNGGEPFLLTLLEGSTVASWQTDLDHACDGSFENPPPYTKGELQHREDRGSETGDSTRNIWNGGDANMLCMTTFRPLGTPSRTTATVMPTIVDIERSRRDSGVLVEDAMSDDTTSSHGWGKTNPIQILSPQKPPSGKFRTNIYNFENDLNRSRQMAS